ncbi:MAG: hypothetical protein R3293_24295 [Candidatus Promineifilaceae bacterium]|nr:hypothetical protein [Candidatus Promineifilaceae bacterium]
MHKRKITIFFILLLVLVAVTTAVFQPSTGHAQMGPQPVIQDANGITGFDLYFNTIAYWHNPTCSGTPEKLAQNAPQFDDFDSAAATGPQGIFPFYALKDEECDHFSADGVVVREGMYIYYAFGPGNSIHRRPITTLLSGEGQPFCAAADAFSCAGISPASLHIDDGYLYWSRYSAAEKKNFILRATLDQSSSPEAVMTAVDQEGPIHHLQRVTYQDDGQEIVTFTGLVRGSSAPGTLKPARGDHPPAFPPTAAALLRPRHPAAGGCTAVNEIFDKS